MLKATLGCLQAHPIIFHVDALDECNTEDVRKMLQVFRDIIKQGWECGRYVRVCFASRPYPQITFQQAVLLDLGEQAEHIEDIARYIDDRVFIGNSITSRAIQSQLREKAAGVSKWAVLIVNILNQHFDAGNVDALQQRLEENSMGHLTDTASRARATNNSEIGISLS